jgi:hypothetical protein
MRPSRLHTTTLCVSSDMSAASRFFSSSMEDLASQSVLDIPLQGFALLGQGIDHLGQRPDFRRAQFLQAQAGVGVDHDQRLLAQRQRRQHIGAIDGMHDEAEDEPGQEDDQDRQLDARLQDGEEGLPLVPPSCRPRAPPPSALNSSASRR